MTPEEPFPFEIIQHPVCSNEEVSVVMRSTTQRLLGAVPGMSRFTRPPTVMNFQGRSSWSDLVLKDDRVLLLLGGRYRFIYDRKQVEGWVVQRLRENNVTIAVDLVRETPELNGPSYLLLNI
jgi:hypothetical protein